MSLQFKNINRPIKKGGVAALGISGLLVAAFTLAPASGAYFSDTKTGQTTVTTGSLGLSALNSNGDGTFDFAFNGLVPGKEQAQTFTVQNTGTIPGTMRLHMDPDSIQGGGLAINLRSLHYYVGTNVGSASVDGNGGDIDLGTFQPGEQQTLTMSVYLVNLVTNDWQNVTATSTATAVLTQEQ